MSNLLEKMSNNKIYNDAGSKWQKYFQEEGSPMMMGMSDLHDEVLYYLMMMMMFVMYMLMMNMKKYGEEKGKEGLNMNSKDLNHSTMVELMWTMMPAMMLMLMAMPSFKLMYSMDEVMKPLMTLKVNGNQWYWTYNMVDTMGLNMEFTSYPKGTEDLKMGELSLLEVDNSVVLPMLMPMSVLMTASDVMHAWAMPSLGMKMDAMPGSMNHGLMYMLSEGMYYGQCSELCGQGHGYMPMAMEGVKMSKYMNWLMSFSEMKMSKLLNYTKMVS